MAGATERGADGRRPSLRRWRERPAGSNWGDFGPDDVLGRLNLVGPEQVRRGVAEVRDGVSMSLSLDLAEPRGARLSAHRLPPVIRPTIRAGHVNFHCSMGVAIEGASDVVSDDLVVLHTQFSTQWDAFGHVGARFDADADGVAEVVYYNGWRPEDGIVGPRDVDLAGPTSLGGAGAASTSDAGPVGIDHMALHGVQGRAVLVDLEAVFGPGPTLVGGRGLADAMSATGAVVEPGDFLLLHTGFARRMLDLPGTPPTGAMLDGTDDVLRDWVRTSGVAAIAADNHAVEAFPAVGHAAGRPVLPLHELCLFRLGVHLGELWWLSDLADRLRTAGRTRFLLTAPPLRLAGATGSPVTPIATL